MSTRISRRLRLPTRRAWTWFAEVLAIYTAIAANFATQGYFLRVGTTAAVGWWKAFLASAPTWYSWACVTPVIVLLARRYRFEAGRWPRAALAHAGGILLVAPLQVSLMYGMELAVAALSPRLWTVDRLLAFTGRFFLAGSMDVVQMYAVIAGICAALDYYRLARQRELRERALEARLAQAELQALRMQLHPHFLFNTLNAISALMHRDVVAAERMVALLADLLRASLDSGTAHEVPLRQELDLLARYVEIEQVRFSDRLTVRFDVAPDTLDAAVPKLILQPLVENALRHGIAPRAAPGEVVVRSGADGATLRLSVRDDGVGLPRGRRGPPREGVGLGNTRARLAQLYGGSASVALLEPPTGGVEVALALPLRRLACGDAGEERPLTAAGAAR